MLLLTTDYKASHKRNYGVELVDPDTPNFREFAVKLPGNASDAVAHMDAAGVLGGFPMGEWWDSMSSCLLIGCDERTTTSDIDALVYRSFCLGKGGCRMSEIFGF